MGKLSTHRRASGSLLLDEVSPWTALAKWLSARAVTRLELSNVKAWHFLLYDVIGLTRPKLRRSRIFSGTHFSLSSILFLLCLFLSFFYPVPNMFPISLFLFPSFILHPTFSYLAILSVLLSLTHPHSLSLSISLPFSHRPCTRSKSFSLSLKIQSVSFLSCYGLPKPLSLSLPEDIKRYH